MAMTLRAYARHRRVTLSSVQAALATGRISALPDGTIDAARADCDWEWNTDTSKPRNSITGTGGQRDANDAAPETFTSARARREAAQAAIAELELAVRRGELVSAVEVARDAFAAGHASRDRTLLIGTRLLPVLLPLVPESEREMVLRLVEDELRAACDDMSDVTRHAAATA